jgi:hypothetical protein
MPYTEKAIKGKFEGNYSEWVAEVLYDICGNSGYDESFGDVGDYGWYALIKGQLHWFIVDEDNNGFFTYQEFDDFMEAQDVWDAILEDYETWLNETEGVHTTKLWLTEE